MPPPKKAQAEPDPNRARTRAGNANTHPGTAAKDALRVRNPPQNLEVIQKEKLDKEAKKAAKQKWLKRLKTRKSLLHASSRSIALAKRLRR